jgi:outer membrane immunogenic protein
MQNAVKSLSISVTALLVGSAMALADGPQLPYEPPVAPPAATVQPDWGGFHAGIYYAGAASGEMFDIGGPFDLNNDASFYGGFLGYRWDLGRTVIGAELSSTFGTNIYQAAFPTWEFERITDLRAMVGRDMGRALVYVSGGLTTSRFDAGGANHTYNGWNAGIGVDFMVSDRFTAGIEYVYRSLESTTTPGWTGEFGAIQIRGAIRF